MTAPGPSLAPRPDHVPVDRVVDFDLYAPPDVAEDYHAAWKTLQERNLPDVVWTPRNGGHWLAIRGRALTEIFQDHQTFSNHIILVPKSVGEEHHLLPTTLDPPEHRVYRGIINPAFVPKRVHALEDTIRRVAVELIGRIGAVPFQPRPDDREAALFSQVLSQEEHALSGASETVRHQHADIVAFKVEGLRPGQNGILSHTASFFCFNPLWGFHKLLKPKWC